MAAHRLCWGYKQLIFIRPQSGLGSFIHGKLVVLCIHRQD